MNSTRKVSLRQTTSKIFLKIKVTISNVYHKVSKASFLYSTALTAQQVLSTADPRCSCYSLSSFHHCLSSSSDPLFSISGLDIPLQNYRRVFQVSHASSGSAHTHTAEDVHTERRTHTHNICLNPQTLVTSGKTCENPSVKSNVFHAYLIP